MAKKPKTPKKPKVITQEQFARWSPEHQQRALNDRRTRIRIEDRALPAEWLERRKQARWNRTPVTPGSSTTYGDLEKQRAYLEPLAFAEGDRQLADRTGNLAAARQRDADWFTQYRQHVSDAQQRAIGAQSAAVEGNKAFLDSVNRVSDSSRDQVAQQLRDRAAELGMAPRDAEASRLADAATQALNVGFANAAQRQLGGAQANVQLATGGVDLANLKDLEAQGYRNRQGSALEQDKKDYGTKKQNWRTEFIDKAIAEARKQVLEDQAFGLKAADTKADNDLARKRLALDRKKARQEAAAKRRTEARLQAEADRRAAGGGSRGGGGGKTPKSDNRTAIQNRSAKSNVAKALSWVARLRSNGSAQSAIRAGLIQGAKIPKNGNNPAYTLPSFDKDVVNTALDIAYRGYIGPANYRIWAGSGYNPGSWGWKIKKKGR